MGACPAAAPTFVMHSGPKPLCTEVGTVSLRPQRAQCDEGQNSSLSGTTLPTKFENAHENAFTEGLSTRYPALGLNLKVLRSKMVPTKLKLSLLSGPVRTETKKTGGRLSPARFADSEIL